MIRSALLALPLIVVSASAFAHSKTEATTPADGETLAEVSELSLRFDDPMRIISATLTMDDTEVALERETGMEPTAEFRALPAEPLAPGDYRFDWRGMGSDGHPMQGGFDFTIAE